MEAIFLTPYVTSWDTYDDTYEDEEDNFLDQQGDMIYPQQQKIKLFDDQDVFEITMSYGQYDEAIYQSLDNNKI